MRLIGFSAGIFDYLGYRDAQAAANRAKLDVVWVCKPSIQLLSRFILKTMGKSSSRLCHGTRRRLEHRPRLGDPLARLQADFFLGLSTRHARRRALRDIARRRSTTPGLAAGCVALLFQALMLIPSHLAWAQAAGGAARFYNSLLGIHVAGYQGWFACPGDGAVGIGWGHWFRGGSNPQDPNSLAIDLWPDTSELDADERCPTAFHLPSGAPAFLFSDQNPKTVARHFAWMRQYGIDGAAMQRFVTGLARADLERNFEAVLGSARGGAEANHRGFFVMYDLSGMHGEAALQAIEEDWPHLAGDLHLTDSPAYIFDRGKPIVGIWGLGFKGRDVTAAQAAAIIRYFHTASVPATVLGGVPTSWRNLGSDGHYPDSRTEPQWAAVYRSLDVISPWSVGRFGDDQGADNFARLRLVPDVAETRRLGIEYMPVVFPGFSWAHGAGRESKSPLNVMPRRCGTFYQRQIDNAIRAGAQLLYTAMFDEINEGTAIFKLAAVGDQEPTGTDLFALNADGCRVAGSDMYLRFAGEATRALRMAP